MAARARSKPMSRLRGAIATGDRVILRRPRASDEHEFVALRKHNRDFLERWEPRSTAGVNRFAASGFRHMLARSRSRNRLAALVCARDSGCIMGMVSLNEIVRGPFQSATMGYWIGREHSRQGYMREAVSLMLGHAFAALGLHRVEANIIPRNKPSIALARVCGLRYEGTARLYLQIAGKWEDHQHWAITREDWLPRATTST
jgi:[ribosomal protein S5]-alanine N-acetyltransferase